MEASTKEATLWICESCGFIYDPAIGDPDGGIPPGTAFEDIPKDWFCPVCGARTSDFRPLEPAIAPRPTRRRRHFQRSQPQDSLLAEFRSAKSRTAIARPRRGTGLVLRR